MKLKDSDALRLCGQCGAAPTLLLETEYSTRRAKKEREQKFCKVKKTYMNILQLDEVSRQCTLTVKSIDVAL